MTLKKRIEPALWLLLLIIIAAFAGLFIWMGMPPIVAVTKALKAFSALVAVIVFLFVCFAGRKQ